MADSNAQRRGRSVLVSSQTIGRRQPWVPPVREVFGSGSMSAIRDPVRRLMAIRDQIRRSPQQVPPNGRPPSRTSADAVPTEQPAPASARSPWPRKRRVSRHSGQHYARHDDPGPDQCTARVTTPARRHRQGRNRQDHRCRRPGARPGRRRTQGSALRGRGTAGHRVAVRRRAAAVRRAADRRRAWTAARCSRSRSIPRPRCWSTSTCSTASDGPGKALDRFGVIDFATTVAPGVRDVLLDRQGLRGDAARCAQYGCAGAKDSDVVRRRGPRRTTDRPDRALPQRQHRGRRDRQGRADPQPGRLDHARC